MHADGWGQLWALIYNVVQGVTTGIVGSVQERLASEGMVRAFSLKEEFPAEYARLVAGETAEIEITADHLPFFPRSAEAGAASTLAFAGFDGGEPAAGEVTFDEVSLGRPATDDNMGALSVPIPMAGGGPWKHKLRIQDLSSLTNVYVCLSLGS